MSDTGSAFEFIRVDETCSQCGETGKYSLRQLVADLRLPCSYCGAVIDLSSGSGHAKIRELAKVYKEIKG